MMQKSRRTPRKSPVKRLSVRLLCLLAVIGSDAQLGSDDRQKFGEIDLRWTPDSKHLSFLCNDHLYLVPVE